jgi:hypothetical protein
MSLLAGILLLWLVVVVFLLALCAIAARTDPTRDVSEKPEPRERGPRTGRFTRSTRPKVRR